jgi:hypothetical protein
MKTKVLQVCCVQLLCLIVGSFAYAESGAEEILEEKSTRAVLYLAEIHRDPAGKVNVLVAWIPDDIADKCIGQPLRYCLNLDNCTNYPDAQECSKDLTSCKPIIRPECEQFGFKLGAVRNNRSGRIPHRVLEHMPYDQAEAFLPFLKSWGFSLDFEGMRQVDKLDKRYSVPAEVYWQLWTNGENFRIVKLLD